MSIRSILVHLANDDDHVGRLRVGYELAKRHDAHLTALYVLTPISMPYAIEGRGASFSYIQQAMETARESAALVEAEFRRWCSDNAVSHEWLAEEGEHLALLAHHGHFADLAVVSQTDASTLEDMIFNELPHHLAMVGSCPALILPQRYGGAGALGRRVLVAWKEGRQCGRAVRDALPLLKTADSVTVALVEPRARDTLSGERLVAWLGRHGIQAEAQTVPTQGRTAATALLETAAAAECDMMVMGGYGHSRMRELVLGGTTHDILSGVALPVLMSH